MNQYERASSSHTGEVENEQGERGEYAATPARWEMIRASGASMQQHPAPLVETPGPVEFAETRFVRGVRRD